MRHLNRPIHSPLMLLPAKARARFWWFARPAALLALGICLLLLTRIDDMAATVRRFDWECFAFQLICFTIFACAATLGFLLFFGLFYRPVVV